jgi:hypothetical protein
LDLVPGAFAGAGGRCWQLVEVEGPGHGRLALARTSTAVLCTNQHAQHEKYGRLM